MAQNGSQDVAIDIPFSGGMSEGAAPFVVNAPFVELAEDCVITKEGAYRRLPGSFSPANATGTTSSRGLAVFDGTLVQHTTDGPKQYNGTPNTWRASSKRGFVPTQVRTDVVVSQMGMTPRNTQIAVSSSGYELYVWDQLGGLTGATPTKGLAIRDPAGGWTMTPVTMAGSTQHQIIALGGTFLIGMCDANGFQVYTLPDTAVDLSTISHVVVNAFGSHTVDYLVGPPFPIYSSVHDVCLSTTGLRAYFLVQKYGDANYYVYTVTAAGQVGTASTGASWLAPPGHGWAICVDNAKVYVAAARRNATGVRIDKFAESGITTPVVPTTVGTFDVASAIPSGRVRITGHNHTGILVAVECTTIDIPVDPTSLCAAAPYVEVGFLPTNDVIGDYTEIAFRAYAHGYVLGSCFATNTGRGPQILLRLSDVASGSTDEVVCAITENGFSYTVTNWVGSYDTALLGGVWVELFSELASGGQEEGEADMWQFRSLARVGWDTTQGSDEVLPITDVPLAVQLRHIQGSLSRVVNMKLATRSQFDAQIDCVRRVVLDIDPPPPLSVPTHGDLQFDGGCQHVWDGQHSFENTPHFPPLVTWVPGIAGGIRPVGSLAGLAYPPKSTATFFLHWEWLDAQGYLHRSGVATYTMTFAEQFLAASGTGYGFANSSFAVLPPLSANSALSGRPMRLVVATVTDPAVSTRAEVLYTCMYDWDSARGRFVQINSTDAGAVFATTLTDGLGYLYTDGGILEANAPPSPTSITSTRDRLWLISADNRRQLYFTKPLEIGVAPEFNAQLTVDIPSDAGEGVAVVTVDDKPVVLCERGLYVISGDGPNALGQQGSFQPQVVQSDTGCSNKNSVAKCDYGVFFQGERGIYLLDRGLSTALVSQGVQDRALSVVSKAVAVPREQQIRFGLLGGGVLVYHYALKAWTVLNKTAYDAVIWDNIYTRVWDRASYKLAASAHPLATNLDAEGTNTMLVRTSWIKADKLQGFARFKRVQLLSNQDAYTAYGPLTAKVFFNYEYLDGEFPGHVETVSWLSQDRKPADIRAQNEFRIGKQKAESIKLEFSSPNVYVPLVGDPLDFPPAAIEGITLTVGTITATQFRHLPQNTKS